MVLKLKSLMTMVLSFGLILIASVCNFTREIKMTSSQIELLKKLRRAPIERWLMDKEEIKDAEVLVKLGYVTKGTAEGKPLRHYVVDTAGLYALDHLEE